MYAYYFYIAKMSSFNKETHFKQKKSPQSFSFYIIFDEIVYFPVRCHLIVRYPLHERSIFKAKYCSHHGVMIFPMSANRRRLWRRSKNDPICGRINKLGEILKRGEEKSIVM